MGKYKKYKRQRSSYQNYHQITDWEKLTEEQKALVKEEHVRIINMVGHICDESYVLIPNIFCCEQCGFEFVFLFGKVSVSYAQCPKCYAFLSKKH